MVSAAIPGCPYSETYVHNVSTLIHSYVKCSWGISIFIQTVQTSPAQLEGGFSVTTRALAHSLFSIDSDIIVIVEMMMMSSCALGCQLKVGEHCLSVKCFS